MDNYQYKELQSRLWEITKILAYICAILFSGLVYAVGKLEHFSEPWFIFPLIIILLVFYEIKWAKMKRQGGLPHEQ